MMMISVWQEILWQVELRTIELQLGQRYSEALDQASNPGIPNGLAVGTAFQTTVLWGGPSVYSVTSTSCHQFDVDYEISARHRIRTTTTDH